MVVDTVLGHREEQIVERAVLVEPVAAEPELHEDLLHDVFGGGMFPPPDDSFREGQEEASSCSIRHCLSQGSGAACFRVSIIQK